MSGAVEKGGELFPWALAMQFGFGVLKLSSAAFWALTPRELEAAMMAHYGGRSGAPLERSALGALMERYPDHDGQN